MITDRSARSAAKPSLGDLLRVWRRRRRMSQLDLACDADISTKHLSFLETGRSKPSRQMLLHLAACLEVPLRDRNVMLGAAGFAPSFQERGFDEPALGLIRRNVELVLGAHDPNPALAVDRHWIMLAANRAVAHLVSGADQTLLRPPVNVLRLSLHPGGLANRIVNLAQWRAHVIARLRRQIDTTGDAVLSELLEELRDYPCPPDAGPPPADDSGMIAIPFRLATIDGVLSFFSTTTLFGTPIDITVSELAIEAFLPANAETGETMRRLAAHAGPRRDTSTVQADLAVLLP
ncbi:helix-turn-helix domain-containing protein [Rhodopila sp.]|uniref:helix-turn-helix domain-containing protein n=1 Tax=Rhodopila sp. TaxID=2480087 RepID=UPI003D0F381C